MSYAFNNIPAKPAFGTLNENLYQSDYINRKKGITNFCKSPLKCQKIKNAPSYDYINSFNLGRNTLRLNDVALASINTSNLIVSQYTKLDLQDVCTISPIFPYQNPAPCSSTEPCDPCQNNNPITIDLTKTFYQNYFIDPLGELFGKSQCGELNYTHHMTINKENNK